MIKYEYVNKELIVSPAARRVYRTAAVVSLTIYFTLAATVVSGPTPLLKQLLFVGVLATAIIMVGMEFFLFRFDDSRVWMQMFWFCALLFVPLGPALYCCLVYSRSKVVLNAIAPVQEDASRESKQGV
jgi:hypothetical protein